MTSVTTTSSESKKHYDLSGCTYEEQARFRRRLTKVNKLKSSEQRSAAIEGIESDLADFDDATSEPSANTYSIVAWIKGLITELGLGFGWAALYFGEVPSPWIWAAIAILFFGLFLVNRTSKPSSI